MLNMKSYLIIVTTFISMGYQQEIDNFGYPPPNVVERYLPQQAVQTVNGNYYSKSGRNLIPCHHRRAMQNVPTYQSWITRPLRLNENNNLRPQSLTEDFHVEPNIIKEANNYDQALDPSASSNNFEDFNEFKTRNSLSVNNEDLIESSLSAYSDDLTERLFSSVDSEDSILKSREVGVNNEKLTEFSKVENDSKILRASSHDTMPDSELGPDEPQNSSVDIAGGKNIDLPSIDVSELADNCVKKSFESNGLSNEQSRRFLTTHDEISKPMQIIGQPKGDSTKSKYQQPAMPKSGAAETRKDQNKNKEDYSDEHTDLSFRDLLSNGNIKDKTQTQILEPKTYRISDMEESRAMLMQSSRVCYACSTANNPTCWKPDRRTTVKYCRQGHNACVTKIFQTPYSEMLIRDCNDSCNEPDVTGMVPKYKSCSICHTDLCNGAYSINSHNIMLAVFIISVAIYFFSF